MSLFGQEIDKAMSEIRDPFQTAADEAKYNPSKNHEVISLIRQPDGNWIGEMWRFNGVVKVRDIDPNTVLNLLLTHPGEKAKKDGS